MKVKTLLLLILPYCSSSQAYNSNFQKCLVDLCGNAADRTKVTSKSWERKTSQRFLDITARENALELLPYKNNVLDYNVRIQKLEIQLQTLHNELRTTSDTQLNKLIYNASKESLKNCLNTTNTILMKNCFPSDSYLSKILSKFLNLKVNTSLADELFKLLNDNLSQKNSEIRNKFRLKLNQASTNLSKLLIHFKSPISSLTLNEYITYKIVSTEEDIKATKSACDQLPLKIKTIENAILKKLSHYYSNEFINAFKDYYHVTKTRFGNCNRISLNDFLTNKKQELSALSINTIFLIINNQHKTYNSADFEKNIRLLTSSFASEFLLSDSEAQFFFNKSPAFSYLGNYYLQDNFFFEETYMHELGHVFEYFLIQKWLKQYPTSPDVLSYSKIMQCLKRRNPKSVNHHLSEDLADWFAAKFLTFGSWNQRSQALCNTLNIENNQYIEHSYLADQGKHSSIIFRLLQHKLQIESQNNPVSPACNTYLNDQLSQVEQIDPC